MIQKIMVRNVFGRLAARRLGAHKESGSAGLVPLVRTLKPAGSHLTFLHIRGDSNGPPRQDLVTIPPQPQLVLSPGLILILWEPILLKMCSF